MFSRNHFTARHTQRCSGKFGTGRTLKSPLPLCSPFSPTLSSLVLSPSENARKSSSLPSLLFPSLLLPFPYRRDLGRAACPQWLQWDAPNSPPKLPLPLRRSPSPSNTPIPRPNPLTIPNGIRIQSAFFHNTLPGHTHTDGLGDRSLIAVSYTHLTLPTNREV